MVCGKDIMQAHIPYVKENDLVTLSDHALTCLSPSVSTISLSADNIYNRAEQNNNTHEVAITGTFVYYSWQEIKFYLNSQIPLPASFKTKIKSVTDDCTGHLLQGICRGATIQEYGHVINLINLVRSSSATDIFLFSPSVPFLLCNIESWWVIQARNPPDEMLIWFCLH